MKFNPFHPTQFSRFGSYMTVGPGNNEGQHNGIYLRSVQGRTRQFETMLKFELVSGDGAPVPMEAEGSAAELVLSCGGGSVSFCFPTDERLRLRGRGTPLKITVADPTGILDWWNMYYMYYPKDDGSALLTLFQNWTNLGMTLISGSLQHKERWEETRTTGLEILLAPDDSGWYEMEIMQCSAEMALPKPRGSYAEGVCHAQADYEAFLGSLPSVPERYAAARERAAYLLWSLAVSPRGCVTRPCIYMSKQIMSYIWGWDNIFNTLVLAKGNPQLAFDQIAIFFDHQSETGMFPDCIDDFATLWTCTKLPIYGWAFLKMLENGALTQGQIRQAYGPLKRWTDWWFNFRDSDRDGIPEYIHGNESGWDNSTIFMVQPPVETADLTAFLLIQMEVLSKFAAILGMEFEKECWDERLKLTQARFYGHFERGGRLVPVRSGSHEPICSQSLLQFIPLILGGRLPRHIRENMINDLKTGGYITQYGLATESVDSPFYGADSYWRGPIWPSATMLLIDALHDCAEEELAVELARKYCDLCVREGFPENFDALAGNALRDKTYSWAAAAFLYLAEKYLR